MSAKSLPQKFLYVIHPNNCVSRIPYFTEHSTFVRLLMKQKKEAAVDAGFGGQKTGAKQSAADVNKAKAKA
jgi:hypothetical protein